MKHQEFLSLRPEQLSNLYKSDDLNVNSEENVFESLMLWIQHDIENRKQQLPSLLQWIKLPLLSSEVNIMYLYKIFLNYGGCLSMYLNEKME